MVDTPVTPPVTPPESLPMSPPGSPPKSPPNAQIEPQVATAITPALGQDGPVSSGGEWQESIYPLLKANGIKHIAYVPDAGHAKTLSSAENDPDLHSVVLTTEQEGIGYLLGAWLGGERGALLMQSSGVGNCVNTLGLQTCTGFPLLMLVTMRGDWAEFNPWQNPMGQATEQALRLMGVMTWRADHEEDVVPLIQGAASMAFDGERACAVLLGQRLIGKKSW